MIVGVVAIVWGLFTGEHSGARTWTNILHNTVFFTGIAFMSLFLLAAHTTAYAGWFTPFKRVWESMYAFLIAGVALIGLIVIGLWADLHHIYHWAAEGVMEHDEILAGKEPLLNKVGFTLGTVGLVAVWWFFGKKLRALSIEQETEGYEITYKKIKAWAGAFLPVAGFSSFLVVLYLVMSVDPHWYSTLFAWYNAASWVVSATAATIVLLIYLKDRGYLSNVNETHFHDLGKYLFGFSIFWTYLWFSQFMLIWYANIGEETIYFQYRRDNFPILFFLNIGINFVLPLLILVRNTSKRRMGIMAFMAGLLLFGHWIDFFLMIKPGVWHEIEMHSAHDDHGHSHDEAHEGEKGHSDASSTINYGEAKAIFTENQEHPEQHSEDDHGEEAHQDEHNHDAEQHAQTDDHGHSEGHDNHATSHDDHGHEAHGSAMVFGFHLPGGVEIGTMLGFLGLFLFIFFSSLSKAGLTPKNDPYLDEGEHHNYDVQGF
ncbi:MAG: hypothetical protein AB8G11_13720 [Saprospiraceae bacterium]